MIARELPPTAGLPLSWRDFAPRRQVSGELVEAQLLRGTREELDQPPRRVLVPRGAEQDQAVSDRLVCSEMMVAQCQRVPQPEQHLRRVPVVAGQLHQLETFAIQVDGALPISARPFCLCQDVQREINCSSIAELAHYRQTLLEQPA